jgi:hypothetical protein
MRKLPQVQLRSQKALSCARRCRSSRFNKAVNYKRIIGNRRAEGEERHSGLLTPKN